MIYESLKMYRRRGGGTNEEWASKDALDECSTPCVSEGAVVETV